MLTNSASFLGVLCAAGAFVLSGLDQGVTSLLPDYAPYVLLGLRLLLCFGIMWLLLRLKKEDINQRVLHLRHRFILPSFWVGLAAGFFAVGLHYYFTLYLDQALNKAFQYFSAFSQDNYWFLLFDGVYFLAVGVLCCGLFFSLFEKKTSTVMAALLSAFLTAATFFQNENFFGMLLLFFLLNYLTYAIGSVMTILPALVGFFLASLGAHSLTAVYESFGFWQYLGNTMLILGFLVGLIALFGLLSLEKNEQLITFKKQNKKAIFALFTPGIVLFFITFMIKIMTDHFRF